MLSLLASCLAFLLTPRAVNIRIACACNRLDAPLSWQEREAVYSQLADLFYYKYVLSKTRSAEVRLLDARDGAQPGWYLAEDI
jgi:hypothetical protein